MYWQQVGDGVAVGIAVAVGVGVEEPDWAQYLPPAFDTKGSGLILPPQTIISLPFQTAV
jgi:aspartate oxidase